MHWWDLQLPGHLALAGTVPAGLSGGVRDCNTYQGQDFHLEKENVILSSSTKWIRTSCPDAIISLGQTTQKKQTKTKEKKQPTTTTKLTTEQLPFQISFSSSNMVYLFLLVCFSLNPSITLQCKMVRLLACASFIMYLSLLITLAENA